MTKKTLIVYTGGTFGMRRTAAGYAPDAGLAELLDKVLSTVPTELPDYHLMEFDQLLDSANMAPSDWYRIAGVIRDHYEQYDGFVILHGTDTMAYTASALSFILQGLDKPVIVTGSQIPLRVVRSDAYNNLLASLVLIEQHRIPEVCLYFNGKLLRGNRATKVSSGSLDAFASPNYSLLGEVGIDIQLNDNALLPLPTTNRNFQFPEQADGGVVLLKLFPGMSTAFLATVLAMPLKGVVIETYGTGNAPTANLDFLRLLTEATNRGTVLVAVSQCPHSYVDLGKYAAGAILENAGVIGGLDMTTEAAYAKLNHLLALGLPAQEVRQRMQASLCGECTTP